VNQKLSEVGCASLPLAGLAALADVRCVRSVDAAIEGDRVWVRWPAGDEQFPLRVLSVSGAELYVERDGVWFRFGSRLPSRGWPKGAVAEPLQFLLSPAFPDPETPRAEQLRRCSIALVRDPRPRPAAAMSCDISALAAWAERATTAEIGAVEGIHSDGSVVLRGRKLPMLPAPSPYPFPHPGGEGRVRGPARRYWGERVFVRLGHRPEPALPESAILAALNAGEETLALLDFEGVELLPLHAFQPLTRAGVRLALTERA
jgi:hypothetical protein